MYTFIASDLDGTLLNNEHRLSDFTKKTIRKAYHLGHRFIFATGRHHLDVTKIKEDLGVPCYMVTANGAIIHDENDVCIHETHIDFSIIHTVMTILAKYERYISVHIYDVKTWFASRNEILLSGHNDVSGFGYQLFSLKYPPLLNINKICVISENKNLLQYIKNLLEFEFRDIFKLTFSSMNFLEVNLKSDSKGKSLEKIARLNQSNLCDFIAFGDGLNDEDMLTTVGKGLLMENANPCLRERLSTHEVIGDHNDDAVAQFIDSFLDE